MYLPKQRYVVCFDQSKDGQLNANGTEGASKYEPEPDWHAAWYIVAVLALYSCSMMVVTYRQRFCSQRPDTIKVIQYKAYRTFLGQREREDRFFCVQKTIRHLEALEDQQKLRLDAIREVEDSNQILPPQAQMLCLRQSSVTVWNKRKVTPLDSSQRGEQRMSVEKVTTI